MNIDNMLSAGERILWRCGLSLRAAFMHGLVNKRLIVIICNLLLTSPFIILAFFDIEVLVLLFVMNTPAIACLLYGIQEFMRLAPTEYCITNRGIYVRSGTGKKAATNFTPFAQIDDAACKSDSLDGMLGTGTVNCFLKRQEEVGAKKQPMSIPLQHIEDYEEVQRIIIRQLAAEKAAEDVPETPVLTTSAGSDPAQAFFGTGQQPFSGSDSFLQPAGAGVNLPEESVPDLQAELFGADAAQQDAFSDPTVNPLPELPESQQGQFLQQ